MQIKYPHKGICTLSRYAWRHLDSKKVSDRRIEQWELLRSTGVYEAVCQQITGMSRATYYRYRSRIARGLPLVKKKIPKRLRKPLWTKEEIQHVFNLRRENPTYGKAKIHHILKRDKGFGKSQSTVGRIVSHLKSKGLLTLSLSAPRPKRKRAFQKHAKRWQYGMKGKRLGQMVQVDHMSVSKNQMNSKHFQAWDPTSKFIHAKCYSQATSRHAKKFLEELIEQAPFPIESIQVDGGSEFMRHFEEACEELGIALYVLPPRRPQYNGGVERGNRIFREEFYAKPSFANSLAELNVELTQALRKYNHYRPHHSLNLKTPLEYIHDSYLAEAS